MMMFIFINVQEKSQFPILAGATYLSEQGLLKAFSELSALHRRIIFAATDCQEACRLLANSRNDCRYWIACGLSDSSYFSRIFKDYELYTYTVPQKMAG